MVLLQVGWCASGVYPMRVLKGICFVMLLGHEFLTCCIVPLGVALPIHAARYHSTAVTAWLPRLGIRTYIFSTGLPVLLSRSVTSYLALYPQ